MRRFLVGLIVTLAVAGTAAVVVAPGVADAVDPCDGSDPPGYCDDGPPAVHRRPRGSLDEAVRRPGGILVTGWVNDPDRGNGAMTVLLTVGGQSTTVSASLPRSDNAVGFNAVVPTTLSGTLSVCATALNVGAGGVNTPIGCRSVAVQHDPIGSLDEVTSGLFSVRVRGWAIDPDTGNPIDVHVYQDGVFVGGWAAAVSRTDVAAAHPGYGALHGFDILLPHPTTTSHTICVYAVNISTGTVNTPLGCRSWVETHGPPVAPTLDELHTGRPTPEGAPLRANLVFNDNSTDETRFVVAVQGGKYAQWTVLAAFPGDAATGQRAFHMGSVLPETTYCFIIHAYNTNTWTHSADERCFTTPRLPPLSPGNLTVTPAGPTSLKVEWDDRTAEPDGYRFWYHEQPEGVGVSANGPPRYMEFFPGIGRRTITLPPNLSPGTRYCVKAVTIVGSALTTPTATSNPWWQESIGQIACGSTDTPPPPAQPTGLTVSGGSQTALDIRWADNATNETGYRVDQQQGSSWTTVADLGANSVSFTDTGLTPGVTFCYRVVAINSGAETASDTACGTTRVLIGIKTANIWNCESHQASGTLWMFDHSFRNGQWTKVGYLPTSWTTSGCGSGLTPQTPAASIDLPDGHFVTLAAVFVDSVCRSGDPAESRCRHWELQYALGDANGLVVPFDFG